MSTKRMIGATCSATVKEVATGLVVPLINAKTVRITTQGRLVSHIDDEYLLESLSPCHGHLTAGDESSAVLGALTQPHRPALPLRSS